MNDARFRGRYGPWAVVAGASEGLGAAFVRELGRRGVNVVAVARRESLLERLARDVSSSCGIDIRPLPLDLSTADAAEQIDRVTAELDIGLLVYNAAVSLTGEFLEHPLEGHDATVAVNCRTQTLLAYRMAARMAARGRGGMLLMSSLAGLTGTPFVAHYAATKAYTRVLAEAIGYELKPKGVDVTTCVAGAIATPGYLEASGGSHVGPSVMQPSRVARGALNHLPRGGVYVPGLVNRIGALLIARLLPRRAAQSMMAGQTRRLRRPGAPAKDVNTPGNAR